MGNGKSRYKMIWVGIGFGAIFWVLEPTISIWVLHKGHFIEHIFSTDLHEIWVRLLVMFISIIFGVYTQAIITRRQRAEETLQEERNFVSAVLDTAGALVVVLDSQGRIVRFNRACEQTTGYSFNEVKGRHFWDLFLIEEEMEPVKAVFEQLNSPLASPHPLLHPPRRHPPAYGGTEGGGGKGWGDRGGDVPNEYENYWVTKDGKRRLITWSNTVLLNKKGAVDYIIGTGIDITERRQAEEELRESEERFRRLSDATFEGIVINDKGEILDINQTFATMFGYEMSELIGMNAVELMTPEFRELTLKNILTGFEQPYESVGLRKDGTSFPIEIHAKATQYHGRMVRVGAIRDVTERRRAETQLTRQSAILNAINQVFRETLTCETEEDVAYTCLSVAKELTNSQFGFIGEVNRYGRFDTIAQSDTGWEACRIPKSNAIAMIKNMEIRGIWGKVLKDEQSQIINDPASHPDRVGTPEGHPPITSFLGVPLKHAGRTIGMIALANKESGYDWADQQGVENLSVAFVEALMRKRAEVELQKAHDELELRVQARTRELEVTSERLMKANRAKSEFLANMSHELRTPLNAIIGFSEVLRDGLCGELNQEQLEAVRDIHESGDDLLQVIKDILDLSKVEAGKMEFYIEMFPFDDILQSVKSVLSSMIKKKGQNFTVKVPDDLPLIYADKTRFKQILYNLLSNAIKFTPEGGSITVTASCDDNEFLFEIEDNGIGIKDEDMDKLFNEFVQLDSSYSRQYEGTGLGLALTKKLVQLHEGNIWAESEYGKGSKFSFTLPRILPQKLSEEDKLKDRIEKFSLHEPDRKTILVVEDNTQVAYLISLYLSGAGYNVEIALDGEEAIQKAISLKPFAITLDIILPKKDGWQVIRELKLHPESVNIPVIILTVLDDYDLACSMNVLSYIVKPVDREQLLETLKKIKS
ncbi:PAS domain S-box protein [Candidatus Poribacteria bacterium]|nr:PAS domain S-box protein [Candidatus Poribacteria bacterium]